MRWSVFGLGAFFVLLHGLVLPPHGFFCGDQGSKYLQARAFAEHGPLNPSIDVRSRDIDPEYRYQEPKLKNRRGRLVSEFLWLLPMASAPFLAVLGMRGLYVVPALSVIAIFVAATSLGRRLSGARGLGAAWTVVLAAPVMFYGLELWEHAPAAACVLVAAALLAPRRMPDTGTRLSQAGAGRLRYVAAGAAIGVAALFREETVPALAALLVARATCSERDRLKDLITAGAWALAGAAAVVSASIPVNLLIYGAPLPMHVTQDAWEVARSTPYFEVRREAVRNLLLPGSHAVIFGLAALVGLSAVAVRGWRRRPAAPRDCTDTVLLAAVHGSAVTLLVIGVVMPLWRQALGTLPYDSYDVRSAAHTWPFILALLYWPWIDTDPAERTIGRFLLLSALLLVAGTLLIIPSDGGAQWSPRFLFPAAPLLALVAWDVARRTAQTPARGHASIVWMARLVLFASFVMQIGGVLYLRGAKVRNARLIDVLAHRTAPGDVMVTDLFAFPEVTATLAPTRRMLFSWSAADIPAMALLASQHGIRRFGIVTSPVTGYEAPDAIDLPIARAPGPTCRFTRGARVQLDELGLTLNRYSCEAP